MPILRGLAPPPEGVGFGIPLFIDHLGSNSLLAQAPDARGRIHHFWPFDMDGIAKFDPITPRSVEVGDELLFGFALPSPLVGRRSEVMDQLLSLLEDGAFDKRPMLGAEVAIFCERELSSAGEIRAAHKHIRAASRIGANIWRDSVMLLPFAKAEIARQTTSQRDYDRVVRETTLQTDGGCTTITTPINLEARGIELQLTGQLASVLGVRELKTAYREVVLRAAALGAHPAWEINAIGNHAAYTVTEAVKRRRNINLESVPNVKVPSVRAYGTWKEILFPFEHPQNACFVLTNSDPRNVQEAVRTATACQADSVHAVVSRPIGYGALSKRKVTAADLAPLSAEVDYLWVVGQHRLVRKTGFAASHQIGRSFLSTFFGVGAFNIRTSPRPILGVSSNRQRNIGTFATTKLQKNEPLEVALRRLLFNSLTEEFYLPSASRVLVGWPFPSGRDGTTSELKTSVGTIVVENYDVPAMRDRYTAIAASVGLEPIPMIPSTFQWFLSLFLELADVPHTPDGNGVFLIGIEGQTHRYLADAAPIQLDSAYLYRRGVTTVVTNGTAPSELAWESERGFRVIHYSSLWNDLRRKGYRGKLPLSN